MADSAQYEELRHQFIALLTAAVQAHESGALRGIATGYDQLDADLPREARAGFNKLHVALGFWDAWIDASNHEWRYYPGIERHEWLRLARGVVDDLRHEREISDPLVQERFGLRVPRSLWARLKAAIGR